MRDLDENWREENARLSNELSRLSELVLFSENMTFEIRPKDPAYVFIAMRWYWDVAIVNQNELLRHVGFIVEYQSYFAVIGAVGVLAAAKHLLPYFLKSEEITDVKEYWKYRESIQAEIDFGESQAEGVNEFAALIVNYMHVNLKSQ